MSIELPSAWSGSKRIGFAEEEMRTVETVELASVVADSRVAARRGDGRTVNVAAALAVPRNLRREMRGVFMGTGKYNGKRIRDFYLLKTSRGLITDFSSIAVPLGFAGTGQPKAAVPTWPFAKSSLRKRTSPLAEFVL